MKKIYTTGEVAKILGLNINTIIKWFDDGKIKGFKLPGSNERRIPAKSLTEFMQVNDIPLDFLEKEGYPGDTGDRNYRRKNDRRPTAIPGRVSFLQRQGDLRQAGQDPEPEQRRRLRRADLQEQARSSEAAVHAQPEGLPRRPGGAGQPLQHGPHQQPGREHHPRSPVRRRDRHARRVVSAGDLRQAAGTRPNARFRRPPAFWSGGRFALCARQSAYNGRGLWWNAGASHMNQAVPPAVSRRLGLVSLVQEHRRLAG